MTPLGFLIPFLSETTKNRTVNFLVTKIKQKLKHVSHRWRCFCVSGKAVGSPVTTKRHHQHPTVDVNEEKKPSLLPKDPSLGMSMNQEATDLEWNPARAKEIKEEVSEEAGSTVSSMFGLKYLCKQRDLYFLL